MTNSALRRAASHASLIFAAVLIALKVWAWLGTGSVSLLTSVVDSVVDLGASLVTFAGVRYADRPADHDHRYGHGKAEALAAFVQAIFLVGAAFALAMQAGQRLIFPEPIAALELGLGVTLLAIASTAMLVSFQSYVVRRTGSAAIAADRAHYKTDVAVNLAVLAALGLTHLTGWARFDPVFGIGIAIYMGINGVGIAREAVRMLLDRELPESERERIAAAVLATAGARGVHDLRTRDAGDRVFVEFHLEVDGALSVEEGHEIGDRAERAVAALFKDAQAIAHLEPEGIDDERLDHSIAALDR